jgi:cytidylate kinase
MTSNSATSPLVPLTSTVVASAEGTARSSVFRPAFPGDSWMPQRLIITIDGPAGTGKSTVARELAARLGLDFLDTGAMYRAAALIALERLGSVPTPIAAATGQAIVEAVRRVDLHFDWTRDPPDLLVDGRSVMRRIRDEDVTRVVSPIAGISELRRLMVEKQRAIAAVHKRLVTEGRDQGSAVFGDADLKFFLYASAEVRAKRRTDELRAKGLPADENRILTEIIERDRSDANRAVGPLICPDGADRVDTSFLSITQVVDELERRVRSRVSATRLAEHDDRLRMSDELETGEGGRTHETDDR